MGIFKKIFKHDNFNARNTDYSRFQLYLAKFGFDLLYIAILGVVYFCIFWLVDKAYATLRIYDLSAPSFLKASNELWRAYILRFSFLIVNYCIYIIFKVAYKLSCSTRNKIIVPMIVHTVYLLLKIVVEILLLMLVQKIIDNTKMHINFNFIILGTYVSVAYLYFLVVRLSLFTFISEPRWFARAKRNSVSYGYKDIGFYFVFWCGDPFYVGTANDGTGKRMYNYYTGNGSTDGDKFAGMRLGLRFFVFSSDIPDTMESILYFLCGAPYKNREIPIISHYH